MRHGPHPSPLPVGDGSKPCMLTSGAASRTTPRSMTENIPCLGWARMPTHLLPPPRPERPAMPSAHAGLATSRPLPKAQQQAAGSARAVRGLGNCPKARFRCVPPSRRSIVRKQENRARAPGTPHVVRGGKSREGCPSPRPWSASRPKAGGGGGRQVEGEEEEAEGGAAGKPTREEPAQRARSQVTWSGAVGSAGSRRSRGRSCGPASRPRRTSPARGTGGTCCRPGPRTAPA
jgi:hypothetical protein